MTALQAVGGGLPLALHIPHVVEQAGSLAGFAAVVGLAILSALYFSQARDLRRLREWAGRAPERAAEMGPAPGAPIPGRVVATPQRPAQPQPAGAPVPAAPEGAPAQPAATHGDAAPGVTAAPAAKDAANENAEAPAAEKPAESGEAESKPGMP